MLMPLQRLLFNPSPQNPNQGTMNPNIIQALINQQPQQQQQPEDPYKTPILDKLKQMLTEQNPPNPEDYKPSFWRKLYAFSAGPQNYDAINNVPYRQALEKYDIRASQLGKGAEVEERQLTNKRIIGQNTEMNRIREEANTTKQELGQAKNEIEQQKADTAAKKERDIYETKNKELEQKLEIANKKVEQATAEAERKQGNAEATLRLRGAQIDMMAAQHKLEAAQKDAQLSEQKRLHDELVKKWEGENKLGQDKLNRSSQPTNTETTRYGPDGKPLESVKRTTQKGPISNQQGKIHVRNKETGQTGWVSSQFFNESKYEKIP